MNSFQPVEIPDTLPDDLATLKAMYPELAKAYNGLGFVQMSTQQQLALLQKHLFGRRSEKFIPASPDQLLLGGESEKPEPESEAKKTIAYERKASPKIS